MKKLFFLVLFFLCLDLSARNALLDSLAQNLSLAKSAGNYEKLKTIYKQYRMHYEGEQDYKNAYNYTLLYYQAVDSLSLKERKAQPKTSGQETGKKHELSELSNIQNQTLSAVLLVIALALIMLLLFARIQQTKKNAVIKQLLEEQLDRSRSIIEAEENDRVRLVHELNDGIGQQISAARLNISALQSFLKITNTSDKLMIQNAVDLLDESVKEVRNVTQKMLPTILIKAGLVEALKSYTSKLNPQKTKIYFENYGSPERTTSVKESVLYRVVVELIDNALKHADATSLNIQIIRHEQELSILVEDNGNGFDVANYMKKDESYGLRSIYSRINFLKGSIFFDSSPSKGTTVTIEIPL